MSQNTDPCGEQRNIIKSPIFAYNFPIEYGNIEHLGHRLFGVVEQIADMYFAPKSPIGRAVLLIRFGDRENEQFYAAPDEIADWTDPIQKSALESAYACAKQKGFIS